MLVVPLKGLLIATFVCSTNAALLERCPLVHNSTSENTKAGNHTLSLHDVPTLIWIVGVYRLGELACLESQVLLHDVSVRVHEKSHHT